MTNEKQPVPKPPTQRELLEQIAADAQASRLHLIHEKTAEVNAAKPPPYTEADALKRCIDALQPLKDRDSSGASYTHSYTGGPAMTPSAAATKRILQYLAGRFDISLVEVREQPCSRAHVDRISPDALMAAVQSAANDGA